MKNILNLLRKIDRWILNTLTEYVKRWIKKHDYTKHKIDFTIELQKIKVALVFMLAMLVPAVTYFLERKYFQAGFHAAIWSISVGVNYLQMQRTLAIQKPKHDILFSLRKNPQVYEMEKEVNEYVFVAMRRNRIMFMIFDWCMSWFFCASLTLLWFVVPTPQPYLSLALYFFIAPFIHTIEQYLLFVFDFDEPEEKKKVVKESISEIVLRAWENLIGGLSPQPNYG